jgi:hypothetical protein
MKAVYTILSFMIVFLVVACQNETGFVNYEKWKVSESPGQGFIKSKPKEVKESHFEVNDTTLYGEEKKNSEEAYLFDKEGNLVSGYTLIDQLLYFEFTYQYTTDGKAYTYRSYTSKTKDSLIGNSRITTKKLHPGSIS